MEAVGNRLPDTAQNLGGIIIIDLLIWKKKRTEEIIYRISEVP
jgi:hypothetical protein